MELGKVGGGTKKSRLKEQQEGLSSTGCSGLLSSGMEGPKPPIAAAFKNWIKIIVFRAFWVHSTIEQDMWRFPSLLLQPPTASFTINSCCS